MRYMDVDDVVFTNSIGETKTLHGCRNPQIFQDYVDYYKERDRELDDLAVKLWGSNMEIMSYRIREQNTDKLLCVDFNEKEILSVKIPPRLSDVR